MRCLFITQVFLILWTATLCFIRRDYVPWVILNERLWGKDLEGGRPLFEATLCSNLSTDFELNKEETKSLQLQDLRHTNRNPSTGFLRHKAKTFTTPQWRLCSSGEGEFKFDKYTWPRGLRIKTVRLLQRSNVR